MKLFHFRPQKILKYRSFLEQKARQKLSGSLNDHREKTGLLRAIAAQRNEYAGICSAEKQSGMDVSRYHRYQAFFQKVNADLESVERLLKITEADIELNREILQQASIRKRMLEKLKTIKYTQYVIDGQRADQQALDEMAVNRRGLNI